MTALTPVEKFELALKAYGSDLPHPIGEFTFFHPRKWRFDYCWLSTEREVAVEIDGGGWQPHGGKHALDRDKEKLNVAAALGWCVIRLSSSLLDDPEYCISLIRAALNGTPPPAICPPVVAQAEKVNAKARAKRAAAKKAGVEPSPELRKAFDVLLPKKPKPQTRKQKIAEETVAMLRKINSQPTARKTSQ
jgi:hypothetical protein